LAESLQDFLVLIGRISEDRLPFSQHDRPSNQIRFLLNQIDHLLLRELLPGELALFVDRAALVEELFRVRIIDPRLQLLPRWRIFGEIVLDDVDALTFQVGDRIAAARSRRFEVHLHAFRHFCLTHHAPAGAFDCSAGTTRIGACSSSIS